MNFKIDRRWLGTRDGYQWRRTHTKWIFDVERLDLKEIGQHNYWQQRLIWPSSSQEPTIAAESYIRSIFRIEIRISKPLLELLCRASIATNIFH